MATKNEIEEVDEQDEGLSSKGLLIQGSDFALKAFNEASNLFDLYLLKVVNKGKANEKLEFKIYGYGMSLKSAVEHILQYRCRKRSAVYKGNGDEGLVKYFQIWCEEKRKLLALFDFTPEEWAKLTSLKRVVLEKPKTSRKKKDNAENSTEEAENTVEETSTEA